MRKENESKPHGLGDRSFVRSAFRLMSPPRRGFRHWILENYRLLYRLDLIVAYASLMLYFASLILIGKPNVASKIVLAIFVVSAAVVALPFAARGHWDDSFRTALKTRRPQKTERMEIMSAVILWAFIAVAVAFELLRSRAH